MKIMLTIIFFAQLILITNCSKMAEDDLTIEREEEYAPREIQEEPEKYP